MLKQLSTYLEVGSTVFRQKADGSILPESIIGYIEPAKSSGIKVAELIRPISDNRVLKVNFVDVQQADGSVIETPDGKIILVDGGDNQMFARYLAGRFRDTSAQSPKDVEYIVVTHGDAGHFAGLSEILKSETNKVKGKRPQRPRPNTRRMGGIIT